jgi:hypothetical protein
VDVNIRREGPPEVNVWGSDVQLVSPRGELADEAEGDEPIAVRPVICEEGRGVRDEDPERHAPIIVDRGQTALTAGSALSPLAL